MATRERGSRSHLGELRVDRGDQRVAVDVAGKIDARMHHRHIVDGQHVLVRQIDRLAAHLHGELRCPDHGRADAIAGVGQRQPGRAG